MEKLPTNNNENNINDCENLGNSNQNENLMEIDNIKDKKPIFITSSDKLSKRKRRRNPKNNASNEINLKEKIKFPKFTILQNKEGKKNKTKLPKGKKKEYSLEIQSKKSFSNFFSQTIKKKNIKFPNFFILFRKNFLLLFIF